MVEVINYLEFMKFHVNYEVLVLLFGKLLRAYFTIPMNKFRVNRRTKKKAPHTINIHSEKTHYTNMFQGTSVRMNYLSS